MLITATLQWVSVDWPAPGTPATTYAVFQDSGATPIQPSVSGLTTTITYDDAGAGTVFFVRPTDGTHFGPAQAIVFSSQPLQHRAWVRHYVRKALSDRLDDNSQQTTKIADDEINDYVNEALRQYSLQFPKARTTPFTLILKQRHYTLPTDCLRVARVQYTTADGNISFFMRDEPYKAGESASQNWLGYPKLGLLAFLPTTGRLYPGHYEVNQGVLQLDFDPQGNGDTLSVDYYGLRSFPVSDLDTLDVPMEDLEALTWYVQAKCWLEIESRDANLSRWRSKEDGGRRDDLPTDLMSNRLFTAWRRYLEDRRSLRPRQLRLARRA